ncbi:DEAD/DEAH box helicase [Clostridium botulinum]|uniref:DEAD/DEAH box helicase n=1 Tax=Clostridium botulinum TaxID=1491 RepID=A0A0L9Y443_CLOBO|nr:DEAD/DEAH box helicase family protein [Clostridium botulinum]KAI3349980.1 DEAD/DEAH box helicase family protein [Clostridium botulinum]KOM86582.1 hypothetical protein ACP51_17375 [Clostridium botulinum]KOR55316.1 hypothetical protein ADT22_17050 [Clostridium botulinum]NFA41585.1 DEAD/DEAH box helicase [Clostridium botulinum]NFR81380.1 DEAD/DEAH box helicase [Clostridium botulinum]
MVDFRKKLGKKDTKVKINPIEIYDSLDRQSDKGELRPTQERIFKKWFDENRNNKDTILKLHTGQGKTLMGLLMLQSYLNETKEPCLYLCPDKYLLSQTCEQADMFGIKYCKMFKNIPDEFISGEKILITTCSKLFNGQSKFGLNAKSININAILLDDAHQCINYIKKSFKIELENTHKIHNKLLMLFENDLKKQGLGTYEEICNNDRNAFLQVPYWAWQDKIEDVAKILAKFKDEDLLAFSWPLIKDDLSNCECIISGTKIEIYPSISLLNKFGTYSTAKKRIFMSATIVEDSYLIKALGVDAKSVESPLTDPLDKWSGEKMILIPSLIDDALTRGEMIGKIAALRNTPYGVTVLTPTFTKAKDWEKYGLHISSNLNIITDVERLKNRTLKTPLIVSNRYEGIDLPDNSCRILVIDSLPTYGSLEDRYVESCLSASEIINQKLAQTIEQGMGRSVRGAKDFSVIILIGDDLVRFIRSSKTCGYFSPQTRKQVELGMDIARFAIDEIQRNSKSPYDAFYELIQQCLTRDEGWKEYYKEEMDKIEDTINSSINESTKLEYLADLSFKNNDIDKAYSSIQKLIDTYCSSNLELKGWYLQKMAKFKYSLSKLDSMKLQATAYTNNNYLLAPIEGIKTKKLDNINLKRMSNTINFINDFKNYDDLLVEFLSLKSDLSFNGDSDKFERAIDSIGKLLGFICQRPDKECKEGPDNLWKVYNNHYFVIECKNQVDQDRKEISKEEVGQLNTSIAWFRKNYHDIYHTSFMIISTNKLSKASVFTESVKIITPQKLNKFLEQLRKFILELKNYEIHNLTEERINNLFNEYKLNYQDIINDYSVETQTIN